MMNTNERIDEKLANGTPCRGLYLKLKTEYQFVKKHWRVCMISTIYVDQIEHIVCMIEGGPSTNQKYFIVKPETGVCAIKLRQFRNTALENINLTYISISSNISTTGHKLFNC